MRDRERPHLDELARFRADDGGAQDAPLFAGDHLDLANRPALGLGTVSVVTPLYGASPIFVLLLSFFFLRGVEALSGRVVAGTLLIVLGVYLITALSGR